MPSNSDYLKRWREANREKLREYQRAYMAGYRTVRREEYNGYQREWAAAKRENERVPGA